MSLVRKILVAMVVHRWVSIDWELLPAQVLHGFGSGLRGFLQELPPKFSAGQVGRMFFGRSDWCLYLGLFACLWGGPAKQHEPDDLLEFVGSQLFVEQAAAAAKAAGHGVSPAGVLEYAGF